MASKKIRIGVTDCSKYLNYERWILQGNENVEVIKLSYTDNNLSDLKKCQGVMLTGGEDVHPRFYHHPEYYGYCYKEDVREERDEFEWLVMEFTERHKIPLLGICRGLQFGNVFFGGTLIPDLVTWGKFSHSKLKDGSDKYHPVQIDPYSGLFQMTGRETGEVNSNHHQSADRIGPSLVVNALSPDGVVEGLERKDPSKGAFLQLLQWHPERMKDQLHPFVRMVKEAFLKAVEKDG